MGKYISPQYTKPIAIFPRRKLPLLIWIGVTILIGLAIVLPLAQATSLWFAMYNQHKLVTAWTDSFPWLALLILSITLSILLILSLIKLEKEKIIVSHDGFYFPRFGRKRVFFPWHYFRSISYSITQECFLHFPLKTRIDILLISHNGKRIKLTNTYENLVQFLKILKKKIFPNIYHQSAKKFFAGKMLHFGALAINNENLYISPLKGRMRKYKYQISFSQVTQIDIRNGKMQIKTDEKVFSLDCAKINNLDVFLDLIRAGVRA